MQQWAAGLSILGAVYGTLPGQLRQDQPVGILSRIVAVLGSRIVSYAVVLAFPNGLAGIWQDHVQPRIDRLLALRKPKSDKGWTDSSVPTPPGGMRR